jgi:hypothetical protein
LKVLNIGHVFSGTSLTNFQEKEQIAGIFGGIKPNQLGQVQELLSWFEAKGKIEQFFKQLNLVTYWKHLDSLNIMKFFILIVLLNLYLDKKI